MFNVADFYRSFRIFLFWKCSPCWEMSRPRRELGGVDRVPASTITSCTMHRTFRGAKRSTGARLEQKLVQLTSPGHAPTASLGCSFFLLPTPAISHPEWESDFSFTTKGSRSPRRWEENQRLDADDRRVSATYVLSGHDRTRDGLGPNQRRPWHVVCLYRHVPLWQRWDTSFLSILGAILMMPY